MPPNLLPLLLEIVNLLRLYAPLAYGLLLLLHVWIRHLRGRTGMTQTEFAELLGASLREVQRWEKGKNEPHWPFLLQMKRVQEALDYAVYVAGHVSTQNLWSASMSDLAPLPAIPPVNELSNAVKARLRKHPPTEKEALAALAALDEAVEILRRMEAIKKRKQQRHYS